MSTLHLAVNVSFSYLEATPGNWLPAWLVFYFLTLAPHDYVIYCQARGLRGHTSARGECVFFVLEDSVHLEAKEFYLLFSSLDSKWAHLVCCEEIFNSGLELLTPLWQAVLGLCCSATIRAAR